VLKKAFIIKQGTCKIVSSGIPKLITDEEENDDVIVTRENLKNKNNGFFSETTNTF
jgi:hypothetical protein